ncbi:MAG: peptide chain release factor 2 [Actinomycetia bacterium]|nr:peptide chain release factor 2 [Actinomycetes bacterium]MCP4088029.1 peptide chain release factor 2 [Actinomycetes bacterium]
MQDFTPQLKDLRSRLGDAEGYLRIADLRARQPQLETEMGRPDLWDDQDRARAVQRELAAVNEDLELFSDLTTLIDDADTLVELASEEGDDSLEGEITDSVIELESQFHDLELRSLFTGEYDEGDAVCLIQSGEGGTDAQDWAEMLLRMYSRWAERRGLDIELASVSPGTEAGMSSAEFEVRGRYAYGLLQSERGVHRLVRMSPFNKDGKRQTAFAALQVVPFIEDASGEVEIDEKDLRIDTYRSSGAGGQHVNVTDSAVRITHLPTGLVTSCQNERSQHQNKDRAMQMLAAKLVDLERQKRQDELAAISGENKSVGFGSQIRSYVLAPYQMVKDLRTEYEDGDVDGVLDGDIDSFMESWLQLQRATRSDEADA